MMRTYLGGTQFLKTYVEGNPEGNPNFDLEVGEPTPLNIMPKPLRTLKRLFKSTSVPFFMYKKFVMKM